MSPVPSFKAPTVAPPHPFSLRGWGLVALVLLCATGGGFVLEPHLSLTSQAMLYVLAVVVVAYSLPWQQSMLCALGAVTAFNFFFVPPRWTFEVDSRENLIALMAMLVVALVISHLAARLRRETDLARLNMGRASQLQGLASSLAAAASPEDVVQLAQQALDAAFRGPCLLALQRVHGAQGDVLREHGAKGEVQEGVLGGLVDAVPIELDLFPGTSPHDADGLRCCMREAAVLGPGTGRWPGLAAWFLPLGDQAARHGSKSAALHCGMLGAACVQPALSGDTAGREHAQALCALTGQALQRLRLTAHIQAAHIEVQRQQLQSTYLAAISHDLRTPLAAIVGAASSLQTQGDKLNSAQQERLLASIVSEAAYLSTVTENTLQLVRLASAAQDIRRDWESLEEIVGAVLARVRQRDPARRIKSRVPHDMPLIQADPVLLAQLIANLLDNALKYSSGAIDLVVQVNAGGLQVAVKDRGDVIPVEKVDSIFNPYTRNDQSGKQGAGLGLALCRAIAHAHGGTLELRRRGGGGNCFTFAMPMNGVQPKASES